MSKVDALYSQLAHNIIDNGYEYYTDNRDVPCKQVTSANLEIPLDEEFPLLTTKKMFTRGITEELLWFLRGEASIKPLLDNKVDIWNKDAYNYFLKDNPTLQRSESVEDTETIPFEKDNLLHRDLFLGNVMAGHLSGDVGRNYGVQWRKWTQTSLVYMDVIPPFDQIVNLLDNLRKPNPISRRHIVTAWNPAELDQTALPPCHWAFEVLPRPLTYSQRIKYSGGDQEYLTTLWQAMVNKDQEAKELLEKELAEVPQYGFILKWHQRSVDTFLGLPFNIASYALLAYIIGSITDMIPMSIIGDLSNVHFYGPHVELVKEQLQNSPVAFAGPKLRFSERYLGALKAYKESVNGINTFDTFLSYLSADDFIFEGYQSFGPLKGEMYEPTK